ncbi:hypothetical protein KRR40_37650 [Niabella defluvii]|nr:hypothetical protein KRR40_37650 [Niabella sp. I65]
MTYEYFIRNRSNILSYRGTVPAIVAANLPPYNLGKVKSWGIISKYATTKTSATLTSL